MPPKQASGLLDLPTEVRLMIYDLFPTITKHHIIEVSPTSRAIVVTKHLEDATTILTCRRMYLEAIPLRRRIFRMNIEPLRIAIEGTLSLPLLQAILLYASNYSTYCHQHNSMTRQTRKVLESCQHLEKLLHCRKPGSLRWVEIAIDCTSDEPVIQAKIASSMLTFLVLTHWMKLPKKLDITVRLRTKTEEEAWLIQEMGVVEESPDNKRWRLSLGERVGEEEWAEKWEVGVVVRKVV